MFEISTLGSVLIFIVLMTLIVLLFFVEVPKNNVKVITALSAAIESIFQSKK